MEGHQMDYNQYDCFVQNTNIINKNMQGKAQKEDSSSQKPPPSYQCGCGEQFLTKNGFKDHSMRIHNAQRIPLSTHFLTPFTYIVIPTNQHQKSTQQRLSQQSVIHLNKEKTPPNSRVTTMQSSRVENTHATSSSRQTTPQDKQKMAKSEMIVQPFLKEEKEEEIEWNRFRLFRNTKVESDHFYCGKCMLTILLPEQFIAHCLQVCQRLKYSKSSHLIICDIPQEKTQQMQSMVRQSPFEKKETKKQQIQRGLNINKTIKYQVCNHVKRLFTKYSGKKQENFFCGGCNKTFQKSYLYATHIRQRHSQIVPTDSSHIILRCRRGLNQPRITLCYIPQAFTEDNEEEIYYCCCKSEAKMAMKKMIKHIMDVHRGISPIYGHYITQSQQTQALQSIKSIMDAQQAPSEIAQAEDPIFSIHVKNLEHRKPPFTCYTCNLQFDTTAGYLNHLHKTINQGQHHLGSHIVLRIQCKRNKSKPYARCLFVSAEEEWHIKEPTYYCPCMPERVTMSQLIQHVSLVHSCMSPLYEKPLH